METTLWGVIYPVHEHDLIIREKVDGDVKVLKCRGCREKIPGQVSYWWCTLCEYYFHEGCAKLALEIKLFFHPCSIFLYYIPHGFECKSCFGKWSGVFTYYCIQCEFDLCVKCIAQVLSVATCSDGKTEQILHCCHRHSLQPLLLKSQSMCQICDVPCLSTPTWGCEPCNFHLHKPCLDFLPETVQTKLGSQVASWVLQTNSHRECSGCDKSNSKLLFRRAGGSWYEFLCISCCLVRSLIDESSSEVPKVINHLIHPSHDLELILSPNSSTCNACLLNHHPFSYQCNICDFFVCLDCAQLPPLPHWHPLKLLSDIEDTIGTHICHICDRQCSEPFYSCINLCQFYVHKSCMDSLPDKTTHLLLNLTVVLLHVLVFECTTCNRQCSGLTFYCSEREFMFCVKCVLWPENEHGEEGRFKSILHWHQLSPCETRIEDKRRICFLCKELCIAWTLCYKCSECALFFHKSCAELPVELEHRIHPQHQLTLINRSFSPPNEAMTCSFCLKSLSQNFPLYDLVYRCHQCDFQVDTQCASNLLASIEYKGHPHLLYVVVNMHGNTDCQVCGKSCKGFSTIFCALQDCDFSLHLQCGPLPYTVKHGRHVHPLTLKDYYVEDNGSDEFACHICEEHRDPRLRVYCCSQGCLMVCDVKRILNEVPQVACSVINNKMMLDTTIKGAGDGIQNAKHIFSYDEILASATDADSDEEETFGIETLEIEEENKLDDKLRSESGEEDEHEQEVDVEISDRKTKTSSVLEESTTIDKEVESYSFYLMALSRFEKSLHTPSPSNVDLDENFLRGYDGSVMTGAYALPEILGQIYEEFFGTYNIIEDKCKINYFQKRFLVFITCSVLHQMRMTKVVDVTKEKIIEWLGRIGYVEHLGDFKVKIVAENIKKLWRAHYYIQSKKIVDDKSSLLERELEQVRMYKAELRTKMDEADAIHQELQVMDKEHETYRVVGSRGAMKYVRTDALEIKWRSCFDALVTYPGNLPH